MDGLNIWLQSATQRLSDDSAAQVRAEIREHYESAREAAVAGGATSGEADRFALAALGDAGKANREYRRVLLTRSEAKLLQQGNREARFFCSHLWLRALFAALPVAALWAAAELFLYGVPALARVALAAALGSGFVLAAPLFPVYTPSRSRIFRAVKWLAQIGLLFLAFGPNSLRLFWLIATCLWGIFSTEWPRASIRRKLPVARWPRQLYL